MLFDDFGEHLAAFLDGEERLLIRVYEDADDYLVEEFAAALDDIQMTVGDGVERAGVDGASHAEMLEVKTKS
jgi:hypothetical protein